MKTYEDSKLMSQKSGISQQKNDKRNIEEETLQLHGMIKKVIENSWIKIVNLTLIRMGWPKRHPGTSFSSVTSRNVGISLQNFLTFSFNPLAILVFVPSASPKLVSLNQDHPSKKAVSLVKSLWNWGHDNFSHRNFRVTKLWSHVRISIII